jgi:hypothetical protein
MVPSLYILPGLAPNAKRLCRLSGEVAVERRGNASIPIYVVRCAFVDIAAIFGAAVCEDPISPKPPREAESSRLCLLATSELCTELCTTAACDLL